MKEEYRKLSLYVKDQNVKRRLILFRGEEELCYLKEWMKRGLGDIDGYEDEFENISIREIIENCRRCNEVREKRIGSGSGENSIMNILNAPRLISKIDKKSLEFKSFELLRKMLKSIDADLDSCYTTNLIKCETDSLNKPSLMFKNCERILKKEILSIRPRIIIVMGDSIPLRNIIKENRDIFWKSIDHPMTLIHNPERKRNAWEALKHVKAKLKELYF